MPGLEYDSKKLSTDSYYSTPMEHLGIIRYGNTVTSNVPAALSGKLRLEGAILVIEEHPDLTGTTRHITVTRDSDGDLIFAPDPLIAFRGERVTWAVGGFEPDLLYSVVDTNDGARLDSQKLRHDDAYGVQLPYGELLFRYQVFRDDVEVHNGAIKLKEAPPDEEVEPPEPFELPPKDGIPDLIEAVMGTVLNWHVVEPGAWWQIRLCETGPDDDEQT